MPVAPIDLDILIFGGGVAGLWTLARLRKLGYNCLLLEKTALGAGQTIASQGIIHGGVKYALTGESSAAAAAIARMPAIWNDCLAGRGEVDLTSCRLLSEEQHLWTTPGLVSRVSGFGASKLMRAEGERLEGLARPPAFAEAPRGVDLYRIPERVLDARSVVEALARAVNSGGRIHMGDAAVDRDGNGCTARLADQAYRARAAILCAGAGNAALMRSLGVQNAGAEQQLRPLHMLVAKGAPAEIFGHCIQASITPRLTITTFRHPHTAELVWYLGGALAEDGVARSPADQVRAARDQLAACVGWLDTSRLRFGTLRIDRAEGVARVETPPRRPDEPTVVRSGPVIAGWPTKLAFAPEFVSRVVEQLREAGVEPSRVETPLPAAPSLPIAAHPWETAQWN